MKQMKKWIAISLAVVMLCAMLPISASAVTLTDIDGSWAKDVILYGVEKGYIGGFTDGTFRPNQSVTRAQFAKMLNNALGVLNSAPAQFTDVSAGAWYYDEVCKAVSVQYVSGYNDGSFRPDATITRQEAAAMISRIVTGPKETLSSDSFSDAASIDAWAKSAVNYVYSKGYMKGDNNNRFDPKGNLTRAQAAQMIYSICEGETIVSSANEAVVLDRENTLFVNNATASTVSSVSLKNCRVLGTFSVGSSNVTFDSTQVNAMSVVGEDVTVTASGNTEIKKTDLRNGASLVEQSLTGEGFRDVSLTGDLSAAIVRLGGSFDTVTMESGTVLSQTGGKIAKLDIAKKSDITLQRGTVDQLAVESAAAGSMMILSGDVSVANAEINAATTFRGAGKIASATVTAAGCSFETQPDHLNDRSGTVEPVNAFAPTVVPASGASNVPVDSSITVVFPETVYTPGRQVPSLQYLRGVLTIRRGGSNGTAIDYSAVVSGRTITVTPSAPLTENTSYFVSISANSLMNNEGAQNTALNTYFTTASAVAGSMVPTVTPANGASAVSTGTAITIAFDSVLFNASGDTLTTSYIESSVAELHVGSAGGTMVSYTASISADRRSIILQPDGNLSLNATYYLVLKNASLRNLNGVRNAQLVTTFTTGEQSTLQPSSVYPADGATSISKTVSATLNFPEPVYRAIGVLVTDNYVRDNVVELHTGSATGETVPFSATVSNNYRTFTIRPSYALAADTTYYIVVKAGTLVTAEGASNSGYITRFATGRDIESDLIFSPATDSVNVPVNEPISITFPAAVVRPGYTNLKESYVESTAIKLRPNSVYGSPVAFTASISADGKTITITPSSDLKYSTKYVVTVEKDALSYLDGTYVGTASASFTTLANKPFTIDVSDISSTSATVSVSAIDDCVMTISYRSGSTNKTLRSGLQFNKGDAAKTFRLEGLTAGGYTYVTVSITLNGTQYSDTVSFVTTTTSTSTQLEEIRLTAGEDTYMLLSSATTRYQTTLPAAYIAPATGASLAIKPVENTVKSVAFATGKTLSGATFTELVKDADGYYNLSGLDFAAGTSTTLYIRVTAENGVAAQTYSVSVNAN